MFFVCSHCNFNVSVCRAVGACGVVQFGGGRGSAEIVTLCKGSRYQKSLVNTKRQLCVYNMYRLL
jgi:hypothetical protein